MTRFILCLMLLFGATAQGEWVSFPNGMMVHVRRSDRIGKADAASVRGIDELKRGQYESGLKEFRRAMDILPDAPVVRTRMIEYSGHYHAANHLLGWQEFWQGNWCSGFERFRTSMVEGILIWPLSDFTLRFRAPRQLFSEGGHLLHGVRFQTRTVTVPRFTDGWGLFLTAAAALSTLAGFLRGRRGNHSGFRFFLRPAVISVGILAGSALIVAIAPMMTLTKAEAFSRLGWIGAYGMTVTLVPYLAGKIGGFATRKRDGQEINQSLYGFQPKGSSST